MEPLMDFIATFGVFIVGLALRALAFVAILAALSAPLLLLIGGVEGLARVRRRLLGVQKLGHLFWRPGLFYAPGHTWIEPTRGRSLKIGVDDLAQRLLPGRARVSLPSPGTVVRRGDPVTTVRADGEETWIPSPVSGTVTAVNRAIGRDPSLLHRDPYVRGWLFRVRPSDTAYEELPRAEPARRWFVSETLRLERMLERELGYAAADGGELVLPAHALLGAGRWRQLTDAFLHAS